MIDQLIEKRNIIIGIVSQLEDLERDMNIDIKDIQNKTAFSNLKLENDLQISTQNCSSSIIRLKSKLTQLKEILDDEIDILAQEEIC